MNEQLELGIPGAERPAARIIGIETLPLASGEQRRESPERALRTREEHLRIALLASKAGTWERDLVSGAFICSDVCKANLGLAAEDDVSYERLYEQIHAEDRRRVCDAVRLAIAHGTDYETEYRVVWPDGTLHWLLARGIALRGRRGHPERLIGVMIDITGRKRADLLLRESEQRFRTLADSMPQLVWTYAPNGEIDYLNEQWRDYVGADPSDFYGYNWHRMLHANELRNVLAVWRTHLESGQPLEIKHRLLHRSGEYRWHLVRGVPLRSEAGQVVKWVGTCTEVHELELRERAARFLNRLDLALARLAEADEIAALAVERVGDYLGVDVCTLSDADPASGRTTPYRAWQKAASHEAWPLDEIPAALRGMLMSGETIAVPDVACDAHLAPAAARCAEREVAAFVIAPHLSEGRWVGALIVSASVPRRWREEEVQLLRDVQARVWPVVQRARAEAAVRCANLRFERAEEAAGGFVYEWNQAACRGACSGGVLRLLGYTAEEAVPHSVQWHELIHPEDRPRFEEDIRCAVGEGAAYALEYRVRHRCGTYVDIWDRGRAAACRPGLAVLTGSVVDFSERRLAEVQVAHLLAEEQSARAIAESASRLKDEFLATVSHELRTPLHAISGWAHVLARAVLSKEDHDRAVDAIVRNAKAQNKLIEDVLDVSRIITGKLRMELQVLDLVAVLEAALDTVRPTAAAKQIRLETRIGRGHTPVLGDAARLQQVVWNVLINALKFTPAGGTVSLDLTVIGGNAQVTVTDTGIGIPADFLPHVFERFRQADGSTTRRHGGLGLGLAIVRHIVEMHGGTVSAESGDPDMGASFVLALPLAAGARIEPAAAAPEVPAEHPADTSHVRLDGVRLLVVDNEPDVLELVAKVLTDSGAHVSTSDSAKEALRLMECRTFDLLILDIAMPETDGYALMREIRTREAARGGTVPAIALTACAHAEERARAFASGFQCHLAKPIEPPALVRAVAGLVRHGV